MISTVSLSFDLSASPPVGIVTDSTDYNGLGLDANARLLSQAKGYGVISFNGTVIEQHDTVLDPMIDLQNWDYATQGTPIFTFPLELDLNGNVANGVYTFNYSLRLVANSALALTVIGAVTAPDVLTVANNEWIYQFLEPTNTIQLDSGLALSTHNILTTTYDDPDSVFTISTPPALGNYTFFFDITNLQLSGTYTYSGCTQVNADVNFTYDCEVGNNGIWAVSNATQLGSNETIASLNCTISYPSWATLSPTFPGNVVVTSLPYPSAPGVETPLATGTYTVSLTEQIQQTQTDGLLLLYTRSVIKEFQVSCAGTLCGLVPCIENLRAAHQAELVRNKISKYQVYVDNVLMYYIEALNYKACGELDKYKEAIACIQAQLDASGCECACCDDETYYWVSNNSGVSVIESLIEAFQFRLFNGIPGNDEDETLGVEVGALWQDYNTGILYRCTVNAAGAAVWVEYYAPGILPIAADIPAVPGIILTGPDVQAQLDQVDALAVFDGINGLNKVGNEVYLGGTLITNTTINADGNSFTISDETNPLILLVDGLFPSVGQNLILQTSVNGGSGANGIGSSIEFQSETTAGVVNRTAVIRSRWTDAAAQDSDFQIAITEGGLLDIGLTVNADKSVTLNGYNSTTFEDPAPAYLLGVDASGNVVQSPSNPLVYAGRTRFSAGAVQIVEYGNTTGATISISNTGVGVYTITASASVFTALTVAFVQMQTAGFVTTLVTSGTVITIRTYDTTGAASDAVLNAGSYVKIEIY